MKKFMKILCLCMIMAVGFSLTGCGGNDEEVVPETTVNETTQNVGDDIMDDTLGQDRETTSNNKKLNDVTEGVGGAVGDVIEDIEDGVEDIGDDVSDAIDDSERNDNSRIDNNRNNNR